MTTAPYPDITDELLSAYIDNAITADERRRVDTAIADDAEIAWRFESLQTTVRLLRELPALALPRSFVLAPEQLGQMPAGSVASGAGAIAPAPGLRRTRPAVRPAGFWARMSTGWQEFWQSGSPALRNAMAASFAVMLLLLVAPRFLATGAQVAPLGRGAPIAIELKSLKPALPTAEAAAKSAITHTDAPVTGQVAPTTESVALGSGAMADNAIVEAPVADTSQESARAVTASQSAGEAPQARGLGADPEAFGAALAPAAGMALSSAASQPAAEPRMVDATIVAPRAVASPVRATPAASNARMMAGVDATPAAPSSTATPAAVAELRPVAAPVPVAVAPGRSWVPIIQLVAALATVVLGLLWWRSRRR